MTSVECIPKKGMGIAPHAECTKIVSQWQYLCACERVCVFLRVTHLRCSCTQTGHPVYFPRSTQKHGFQETAARREASPLACRPGARLPEPLSSDRKRPSVPHEGGLFILCRNRGGIRRPLARLRDGNRPRHRSADGGREGRGARRAMRGFYSEKWQQPERKELSALRVDDGRSQGT